MRAHHHQHCHQRRRRRRRWRRFSLPLACILAIAVVFAAAAAAATGGAVAKRPPSTYSIDDDDACRLQLFPRDMWQGRPTNISFSAAELRVEVRSVRTLGPCAWLLCKTPQPPRGPRRRRRRRKCHRIGGREEISGDALGKMDVRSIVRLKPRLENATVKDAARENRIIVDDRILDGAEVTGRATFRTKTTTTTTSTERSQHENVGGETVRSLSYWVAKAREDRVSPDDPVVVLAHSEKLVSGSGGEENYRQLGLGGAGRNANEVHPMEEPTLNTASSSSFSFSTSASLGDDASGTTSTPPNLDAIPSLHGGEQYPKQQRPAVAAAAAAGENKDEGAAPDGESFEQEEEEGENKRGTSEERRRGQVEGGGGRMTAPESDDETYGSGGPEEEEEEETAQNESNDATQATWPTPPPRSTLRSLDLSTSISRPPLPPSVRMTLTTTAIPPSRLIDDVDQRVGRWEHDGTPPPAGRVWNSRQTAFTEEHARSSGVRGGATASGQFGDVTGAGRDAAAAKGGDQAVGIGGARSANDDGSSGRSDGIAAPADDDKDHSVAENDDIETGRKEVTGESVGMLPSERTKLFVSHPWIALLSVLSVLTAVLLFVLAGMLCALRCRRGGVKKTDSGGGVNKGQRVQNPTSPPPPPAGASTDVSFATLARQMESDKIAAKGGNAGFELEEVRRLLDKN